jgi:hypothetical protein
MSTPSGPFVQPSNDGPFTPPPPQASPGIAQPLQPQAPPAFAQPQQQAFGFQPQSPQPGYPQQQPTAWRTLTLDLKQPPWYGRTWLQPTVTIDGFASSAGWTRQQYQIPADRPVHVQCHVNYLWAYGKASAVLQPGHAPYLEYTAPAQAWFDGEIGAPGTTTAKGKAVAIGFLVVFGILVLGIVAGILGIIALGAVSGVDY